jgi:uncharacterized protein YceH (UPF0502 family)
MVDMSEEMEQEPVKRSGLGRLTELQPGDVRVLGVLIEKEQTTPEYYPMSLKAIVAACNQKTSRDPVMSMSEQEVLNILRVLAQEKLADREYGARVDRWRHSVDPLLKFKPAPKALLSVLLLRGAQTPGELRTRCERMFPFESLSQVEELLHEFATGEDRIIHRLPRQPGQKEDRWVLGIEGHAPLFESDSMAASNLVTHSLEERLGLLEARVEELQSEVRELRQQLAERPHN